jgi:hypothetical protein
MYFELIHVLEDAPDKLLRGVEILQGDVVRNSIQIGQCGINDLNLNGVTILPNEASSTMAYSMTSRRSSRSTA